MTIASSERYKVRLAQSPHDLEEALGLRTKCFRAGRACGDRDQFDDICAHYVIRESGTETLVGYFRLFLMQNGAALDKSYSSQFYDLDWLKPYPQPIAELGRFCIHPDFQDPDILRLAWGGLTKLVDENSIGMLIGCSSFSGVDPGQYRHSFGFLDHKNRARENLCSPPKSTEFVRFADFSTRGKVDLRNALKELPPLLRTYLSMGAVVSDHAVIDRDLCSMHVFTSLEIENIPSKRARLLRKISS